MAKKQKQISAKNSMDKDIEIHTENGVLVSHTKKEILFVTTRMNLYIVSGKIHWTHLICRIYIYNQKYVFFYNYV